MSACVSVFACAIVLSKYFCSFKYVFFSTARATDMRLCYLLCVICNFSITCVFVLIVCDFSLVLYLRNHTLTLWHLEHRVCRLRYYAHTRRIASVYISRILCAIASRYMRLHR